MPTFGEVEEDDPQAAMAAGKIPLGSNPVSPWSMQAPPTAPQGGPAQQQSDFLKAFQAISGEEAETRNSMNKELGAATDSAIQAGRDYSATSQKATDALRANMQRTPSAPSFRGLEGDAMQWMALVGALGALMGRGSRNAGVYGLKAMTGLSQGFAQGNLEAIDLNMQQWKASADAVERNNQREIDSYNAIMKNQKTNWDQKMQELQLISSKWQNQLMASAAQKQDLVQASSILNNMTRLQDQYTQNVDKLSLAHQKFEAELAKNGLTRDDNGKISIDMENDSPLSRQAQAIANYQQPPLTGYAARSFIGQRIMGAVMKKNPQYDATKYAEKNRAQIAFGSGRQGDQIRALNVSINHLGTAEQLVLALGNKDIRAFNAANQKWALETGQPAPTNFDAAKQIIGQEVVKSVVTGGGGVTERQQAGELLSRANSPQQLLGAIQTIKRLMAGQMQGLQRQYQSSTQQNNAAGAAQFGEKVAPETERELGGLNDTGGGETDPTKMSDDELKRALGIP